MGLVEFRNVFFSYNQRDYVFENVTFELPDKGITAVISDPGKGKSTLLKLIKGILKPSKGVVVVMNIDTSRASKSKLMSLHTKVSIHFQDTFLISNIDVFSNIALPLLYNTNLTTSEVEKEVDRVLDLFDLRHLKYELPHNLSPTEAKFISISRAFLMNPRLILLDEPFSQLDSSSKLRLIEIIEEYKNFSKILFTTSDDNLVALSDSIVYILTIMDSKDVTFVSRGGQIL
ncbi:MAG: ATP-binding cassette domain-containing protein [Brevinematia bacterium]